MHDYWLKFLINVVFIVGHYGQWDDVGGLSWHVYMLMLLAASMCIQVFANPFIAKRDDALSVVVLMSLAVAVHLNSLVRSVKFAGLAQNSDQLQASNKDFHSNCWANLRILGRSCEFQVRGDGLWEPTAVGLAIGLFALPMVRAPSPVRQCSARYRVG
jgi:hypothetical protein